MKLHHELANALIQLRPGTHLIYGTIYGTTESHYGVYSKNIIIIIIIMQ